jgi:Tol biopolymer transport system component
MFRGVAMQRNGVLVVGVLLAVLNSAVAAQESFNPLRGPYMGQEAGDEPKIFLPGKISTGANEGCSFFYPGARSFLWRTIRNDESTLLLLEDRNGRWQPPRQVRFLEDDSLVWDFTLAPDGASVYFTSDRRQAGPELGNIWRARFESGEWRDPVLLGPEVNSDWNDSYPSVSRDGDLYFFRRDPLDPSDCDLYVARSGDAGLQPAVRLDPPVNSPSLEYDPFISPDGSYLIFSSRRLGGYGLGDLYISFWNDHDGWGEPINLGPEINSPAEENRPSITLDGRYFFFTSTRIERPELPPGVPPAGSMPGGGSRDIYWMKAHFIQHDRLGPSGNPRRFSSMPVRPGPQ